MVEIGVLIKQVGENLEINSNSKKEKDDISAYGTTAPGNTAETCWGAVPGWAASWAPSASEVSSLWESAEF